MKLKEDGLPLLHKRFERYAPPTIQNMKLLVLCVIMTVIGCKNDPKKAEPSSEIPAFSDTQVRPEIRITNVEDIMKDTAGITWAANHSDNSPWLCEITFKRNYAVIWYHGQCQYEHFIYKTSDSTIVLLWAYRPDCISDMSFLESSHGLSQAPKPNRDFATYTLENDSTLRVDYKYPDWVKKVNAIAKDSLFPRRLHLQKGSGA